MCSLRCTDLIRYNQLGPSLWIVSKHRREVLNGPRGFPEYQRDVLDRKRHENEFLWKTFSTSQTSYKQILRFGSIAATEMYEKWAFEVYKTL